MPHFRWRLLAPCCALLVVFGGLASAILLWPHLSHAASPLTAPTITSNGNGLGEPGFYTFSSQTLNQSKQYHVNVANGNLVVHADDLHIRGTGIDLAITSEYNNLAGTTGRLGQNWTLGVGGDVRLASISGGVDYYRADGYAALFATAGSGYTDAPGLNATLVNNGDGTYTLTFHRTGEVQVFDNSGKLTADKDKNSNTIHFTYDGSGKLTTITDTQGREVTIGYTGSLVSKITDSTGRAVNYFYDSSNRLTIDQDLRNINTTYGYTGSDLTSITDPLANTTQFTFDTAHRVTKILDPLNGQTTFTYTTGNTVVTDNYGHSTTYTYDTLDQVTAVKDAHNNSRSTTYSPNADVTTTTDPLTNATTFTYSQDGNNNLQSLTDATGAATTFGYTYSDSVRKYLPTAQTDAGGNQLAYTYTPVGNMDSVKDTLTPQHTTTLAYNSNGTVSSVTDGNSHQTTYGYDTIGNLTRITPPSPLGGTALIYDSLSRLATVTDGKGQKTSYYYDRLDRVVQIAYAGSQNVYDTYDDNGNVLSVQDPNGTTTFTYDADNHQKTKTLSDGTTFTQDFDAIGNLVRLKLSSCPTCAVTAKYYYNFDIVNRLVEMGTQDPTTQVQTPLADYTYDNADRRTGVSDANGVMTTIGYDTAGKETSIVAKKGTTTLTSFTYDYTKPNTTKLTGLRYKVTNLAGDVTAYAYDGLNRLTGATTTNGGTTLSTYGYTYDGASNRLTATANGTTTTFGYNAANELTSSTGGITYSYDANGNLTADSTGRNFGYNTLDQTTSFTPAHGAGMTAQYAGTDQTERTKLGATPTTNSALGLYHDGTATYIRDNQGQLVAEQVGSSLYYYLFDGLGSVVGLTNSSGTLVATYQYDPYGNLTSSTGSVSNPYRFAGGYYDSATSLYKFGTRYYDPKLGRWTQEDPQGRKSNWNASYRCNWSYNT